ncbi:MAG: efflux RND transporter periplasmic adaptor subunit [Cellvibrionaceae bacterium]
MNWFKQHKHLSAFLVILLGLVLAVMVVILKPRPKPKALMEPSYPVVRVLPARYSDAPVWVKSQGSVKPKREIDVVAQVSGRVVSVSEQFAEGGLFTADQALLAIDPRDYQYALLRAQSQVKDAEKTVAEEKARARQAKREWRDLGSVEANDLFLRKPQLAAAQARLEAARADRDQAKLNVARTRVNVPFQGRVLNTAVNLGQFVNMGSKVARVYSTDVAEIRLPLSDSEAMLVGLPIQGDEALPVELIATVAGEKRTWQARLVRGDTSMDTQTRQFFVVAEVESPVAKGLPMGLFVEARIQGRKLQDIVTLPRTALYQRDKVLRIGAEETLQALQVQVLAINEKHIQIRGAIQPGDKVVARVTNNLIPGIRVNPEEIAVVDQSKVAQPEMAKPETAQPAFAPEGDEVPKEASL